MRSPSRRNRLGLSLVTLLAMLSIALGSSTTQTTSSAWSDNVWAKATITTVEDTSTTSGPVEPGTNTVFPADAQPVWTQADGNNVKNSCVLVTVTTNSTTAVKWSVILDTSAAPWNGVTNGYRISPWNYDFSGGLTDNRYLTIVGYHGGSKSDWTDTVVKGQTWSFTVCNDNAVPALGDSSWYSISVSTATLTSTDVACKTITATSLNKTNFWFKWQATTTTADLFALLPAKKSYYWSYNDWNVVRSPSELSTNPDSPSTPTFTSAINDTNSLLRGTKSFTYTLCLTRS